ncbi:MAG: hypothetical protein ABIQ86_12690 [Steroidobacteraceae bacterium]
MNEYTIDSSGKKEGLASHLARGYGVSVDWKPDGTPVISTSRGEFKGTVLGNEIRGTRYVGPFYEDDWEELKVDVKTGVLTVFSLHSGWTMYGTCMGVGK